MAPLFLTLHQRVLCLLAAIGKMVDGRRYHLPAVFATICAQLVAIVPMLAHHPTKLSPDLIRGHTMLGQEDLPYHLVSAAEQSAGCPDLYETQLTSGYCNIGFFGKHIVVKNKYLVGHFRRPGGFGTNLHGVSSFPTFHCLQGLLPSANNDTHDTATVLNFKQLYISGDLSSILSDLLLFLANVESVCGILNTTLKATVEEHWSTLSNAEKKTGRMVQVSIV